jgi:hypothetical protein
MVQKIIKFYLESLMEQFKTRVIELTSKHILLSNECVEIKNTIDITSFSDKTRGRLVKKLIKKRQALDHLSQSLKVNIYLSNK